MCRIYSPNRLTEINFIKKLWHNNSTQNRIRPKIEFAR